MVISVDVQSDARWLNMQNKQLTVANQLGVVRGKKPQLWWKLCQLFVLNSVPGIRCSSSGLASLVIFNISIGSIRSLAPPCERIWLDRKSSKGRRKNLYF